MGLAEKRAIKEVEENIYPKLKEQLIAILGFEPEFEIDWASLAEEGKGDLYAEGFEKIYFAPALACFESVCADDLGKEAIQETLKKIIIKNEGTWSASQFSSFEGGILTLEHEIGTNHHDVEARTKTLQDNVEAAL